MHSQIEGYANICMDIHTHCICICVCVLYSHMQAKSVYHGMDLLGTKYRFIYQIYI